MDSAKEQIVSRLNMFAIDNSFLINRMTTEGLYKECCN